LKKQHFNKIKDDVYGLIISFVILVVIFKMVVFKESLLGIFITVVSLYWLYVLPGFFVLSYWKERFSILERLIMGFVVGIVVVSLPSYYLGVFGLHMSTHVFIPLVIIMIMSAIFYFKSKKD
jgi:uncharacterized membrane protein